ncbi:MAG: periplasmic heavy metal sensor [Bacteroidetes bacterium]|nr:periplasmic heavy metal sensor [Bacteroidota bacterium]MBX7047414.1 periplasmic heavy metal sensor [Ignavibacteria bacterium]
MDIFSKSKYQARIIFILLAINVFTIVFWGIQLKASDEDTKPRRDAKDAMHIIKNKLNLTSQQEEKFALIREDFFKKEQTLSTLIKQQRDSMNTIMFNEKTDMQIVKDIAKRVADNGYKMELYRIEQSQQLKEICTPEQLKKFEELVREIKDYFKPEKKKNK